MKSPILRLIELVETLNPTGEIGDGTVFDLNELASLARLDLGLPGSDRWQYKTPRFDGEAPAGVTLATHEIERRLGKNVWVPSLVPVRWFCGVPVRYRPRASLVDGPSGPEFYTPQHAGAPPQDLPAPLESYDVTYRESPKDDWAPTTRAYWQAGVEYRLTPKVAQPDLGAVGLIDAESRN